MKVTCPPLLEREGKEVSGNCKNDGKGIKEQGVQGQKEGRVLADAMETKGKLNME